MENGPLTVKPYVVYEGRVVYGEGVGVSARGQIFAKWTGCPHVPTPTSQVFPRAWGCENSNKATIEWGGGSTT